MRNTIHLPGLQDRRQYSTPSTFISILVALFLFASCSYAQHLGLVQERQAASCSSPGAVSSSECWEDLGIPAWISEFSGSNSTCARSNIASLTQTDLSWGDCFVLAINHGTEGQRVDEGLGSLDANTTVDSLQHDALEVMPLQDRPRYVYVLRALSRIRSFFVDWNDVVSSSATANGSDVSTILAALDPENRTSFAGRNLYQALTLGLPFYLAYNGTGIPLGLSLQDIGGVLYELVYLARVSFSNASIPSNTSASVQASALPFRLPQVASTVSSAVQNGLREVTAYLATFRVYTEDGTFVAAQPWSIPQDSAILAQPLNTFLASSILAQNNWTVLALVGIDVAALAQISNGTLPYWALSNCPACTTPVNFGCTTYNENGQCGRWWYSEDLNSSFTLIQTSNLGNDPTDLITTIFDQGWSTGSLLFENAAICDEPSSLGAALATIPTQERPSSPLRDYMDSWFWKLLAIAPVVGEESSVDIVVSSTFNRYIESRPGPVSHPANTLFSVHDTTVDFACMSQLDLQVAWNWTGIIAGDFS